MVFFSKVASRLWKDGSEGSALTESALGFFSDGRHGRFSGLVMKMFFFELNNLIRFPSTN